MAAIDIGSNAIRLSLAEIESNSQFRLTHKYRIPLRLGREAFGPLNRFSTETMNQMVSEFVEFREKMKAHHITHYRAMATSACRDALNGDELLQKVLESTGIVIEEISGIREARLVMLAVSRHMKLREEGSYLLCDLGGGSLELSDVKGGDVRRSKSFNIGTVRLLPFVERFGLDSLEVRAHLELFQQEILESYSDSLMKSEGLRIIGTGGNFRRLFKLKKFLIKGKDNFITPEELNYIFLTLKRTTIEERIKTFKLRPDRAEVILPALMIIKMVVDKLPVKRIYTPSVGLIEGIIAEAILSPELAYPLS